VDAPVLVWYLPASQFVHAATLALAEKVPAAQLEHEGPDVVPLLNWPGLQTTVVQVLEPGDFASVEDVHAVQIAAPPAE